ncbi:L-rhamnose mutarotase [Burkholderia ambifaria]|jgi:L-rhamnose mutarotase|uniref:L-rhamnose mutarotase n=1 Tax=Burkholderia TaxID=32008 RepID=UPI00110ED74C|nr:MULTISPECIES: L-rhamnose mutarotase [Burkholderia]MBR8061941.1 L-rhamnose mutarotase [Burkholderia ambifaria]QDW50048.1 L-rhamnose mutarotase [Burkholderia sp. KBS0801]
MRYCLALDLKDDPDLIARYEEHHRAVWPDVLRHLREHGVRGMEIFRLGTRMTMVMDTDDAVFDAERMAKAAEANPTVRAWEDVMWTFQAPTPWTPAGLKWTPMTRIFDLRTQT